MNELEEVQNNSEDKFRPQEWSDMIGQEQLKTRLLTHIAGALENMEPLSPVLLAGPPGSGKTTIAGLVAKQMGYEYKTYITVPKKNMLKALVRNSCGTIVLFDEIHRWSQGQQEDLLPLLEDGYLQLEDGEKIWGTDLTIIGATTEPDKIVAPLYDRFTIKPPFEDYTDDEMARIVKAMSIKANLDFSDKTAMKLGRATGGVPRNAKVMVLMARDAMTNDAVTILDFLKITEDGLTQDHVNYLKIVKKANGQCGLQVISAHLQIPNSAIIGLEKLLMKRDLIQYSTSGRTLTPKGYKVLKGMNL